MMSTNDQLPGGQGKLRLFSLYADVTASERARAIGRAITQLAGPGWQTSSEMWRPEALAASEAIRNMINRDAVNADILVVAVSSLREKPADTVAWLESIAKLASTNPVPGLMIGLFGDGESDAAELDWTVKQLLQCSRAMQREFIWHWMGADSTAGFDWLEENVESLLDRKNFLHQQVIAGGAAVGAC